MPRVKTRPITGSTWAPTIQVNGHTLSGLVGMTFNDDKGHLLGPVLFLTPEQARELAGVLNDEAGHADGGGCPG